MAHTIDLLILLSGVFSSCHCGPAQYNFVSTILNWTEAQNYCRKTYRSDLVTIAGQEDHTRLKEYMQQQGYAHSIWIGLYDDVNSWKWSLDGLSLEQTGYINWHDGEPNNQYGKQACSSLSSGKFSDFSCTDLYAFVCYDGNEGAPNKYVYVSEPKSWSDAQSYCRQHHTDLASVQDVEEKTSLTTLSGGQNVWIGLHRDTWKWSDGNPSTFRVWQSGRPSNRKGNENCAYYVSNGWADNLCYQLKAFVCNSAQKLQVQTVRIGIKMDSTVNMEDPVIQAALAEQIRLKLQENGQPVGCVSWKSQPDGKVFHQQKNEQTKKKREKRSEL